MGKDVILHTVFIDPSHDQPDAAKDYARTWWTVQLGRIFGTTGMRIKKGFENAQKIEDQRKNNPRMHVTKLSSL